MTLLDTIKLVEGAKIAGNLFGKESDAQQDKYRKLAKVLHPDLVTDGKLKKRAADAFAKLADLYAKLNGKTDPAKPVVIGKWVIGEPIAGGDICDLYTAASKDAEGVLKIARLPRDNDLVEQEGFALKFLHAYKDGGENYLRYIPKVFDSFEASGRRANVLTPCVKQWSLADIVGMIPDLDFRHCVWMLNRALSALGYVHRAGVIHGAVVPSHLVYGPANHSLSLVDWCYSVTRESKKHIPAVVKDWKQCYPAEVSRKLAPLPSTDLYMLFASFKSFDRISIPKKFGIVFDLCLAGSPNSRPGDAWEVQDRLKQIAEDVYGPPRFLELKIPIT